MQRACLKCGAISDGPADPAAACPGCGAIYAKVIAARRKKEADEARAATLAADAAEAAAKAAQASAQRAAQAPPPVAVTPAPPTVVAAAAKPTMPQWQAWLILGFAAWIVFKIATCSTGETPNNATPVATAKPSMAQMLAALDGKKYDEVMIRRYDALLVSLSSKFEQSPSLIGDMTQRTAEILQEKGIQETRLRIMEGMNFAVAPLPGRYNYAEFVASYSVLRQKSFNHDDAVESVQAAVRALMPR